MTLNANDGRFPSRPGYLEHDSKTVRRREKNARHRRDVRVVRDPTARRTYLIMLYSLKTTLPQVIVVSVRRRRRRNHR